MAPIRISRAGLVQCPACHTHTYVAEDVHETACNFCKAMLRVAADGRGLLATIRAHVGVTGGALAAALAGMSVAACSDDGGGGGAADTVVNDGQTSDVPPTDVYGSPPDADAGSTADTGSAADTTKTDAGPTDTAQAKDTEPVALYGGPPIDDTSTPPTDAGSTEDAGASKDTGSSGSDDIAVAPLYGLPIPVDACNSKDEDAGSGDVTDADEPPPQPEYGIPPG